MKFAIADWYMSEFKTSAVYKSMEIVKENSPFHREDSVAEHTDMVFIHQLRNHYHLVDGLYAAAFHDTGKPLAKKTKFHEERGHYLSFKGHEQMSARIWENWAVQNSKRTLLTPSQIVRIGYMIEHHKPWKYSAAVSDGLARTLSKFGCMVEYFTLIQSDTVGRISDTMEEDLIDAEILQEDLYRRGNTTQYFVDQFWKAGEVPTLFVPIAAAGSGKSSLYKELVNKIEHEIVLFGLDDLRLRFYSDLKKNNGNVVEDYHAAYMKSRKDPEFRSRANAIFKDLLRSKKNVFLDNINVTRQSREFYIKTAKAYGYKVVAYLLPIDLDTLIRRQESRGDKMVPAEAVTGMYNSLQLPLLMTEVDDIQVHTAFDSSGQHVRLGGPTDQEYKKHVRLGGPLDSEYKKHVRLG